MAHVIRVKCHSQRAVSIPMANGQLRDALTATLITALMTAPTLAVVQVGTAAAADNVDPWIDTSDRAAVIDAYIDEFDRTEPASEYDGDAEVCDVGTTSQAYRDSIIQRLNWYRRMAGLDVVTERPDYTSGAQQSSLMMSAEGGLSHDPSSEWACLTEDGATTAGKSNLALGISGIRAIDAYVRDPGGNNQAVGHRRTIFYPQLLEVGTGDVDAQDGRYAANTLRVFDDNLWGLRPEVREAQGFVAWPPSGYVPAETAWGRWSFSLSGADFSNATVSVQDSLGAVQVSVLARIQPEDPNSRLAPEPTLVWAVGGDTNSAVLPPPTNGDECYDITVGDVSIGGATQPDYTYRTCVIDPEFEPPQTAPLEQSSETPAGNCSTLEFGVWTVPCWTGDSSLAGFTDVVTGWQREPVAWLVGNGITTGVSETRFDPDSALTRAQAATLIWRLAGSPTPPADAPTFSDVPASSYYRDAVRWMAANDITTGTGADRFSPAASATRAEFVTLLWRLVDEPSVNEEVVFTDLTASWQVPAVRWAAMTEVTTGTSATSFSPDVTVTRGQAAALLARFAATVS
jgi:S-layer homology domain/Cysteine-rich secretory protein family